MEPIIISRSEPMGNAFGVMATVKKVLKAKGKSEKEIEKGLDNMMSGDYENLIEVAEKITDGGVVVV